MKCILKEFKKLKEAEAYINTCINEERAIGSMQIAPYQIEPCVPRYLVTLYEFEQGDEVR